MNSTLPKNIQPLFESAKSAREKSYSPYSRFRVGAAVRMRDGRVFAGTNVENSSYGGTVCAERVAIVKAVSETTSTAGSRPLIEEILVLTDTIPPSPPCGICRQVISEFADSQTLIHISNLAGQNETLRFEELLPRAFDATLLPNK